MAQPNAIGVCNRDALVISGGAGPVPVLCGDNTGQHIYLDFNGNSTIDIITSTLDGLNIGRNWNYKVTQIACSCPTRGEY